MESWSSLQNSRVDWNVTNFPNEKPSQYNLISPITISHVQLYVLLSNANFIEHLNVDSLQWEPTTQYIELENKSDLDEVKTLHAGFEISVHFLEEGNGGLVPADEKF